MVADELDGLAQIAFDRRMRHKRSRFVARDFQNIRVAYDIPDMQRRESGLLGAEELAGAAQLHVHLGDVKSIA